MRHIIPISGKDSLAAAIWQMALDPSLPYEFIYNDTRAELPDTYAWLDAVEKKMGITITRIGKSLENIIEEQGMLPSVRIRFCTKYSKIFPMRDFLGKDKALVYFGLRADEPERIGALQTKGLEPKHPLREAGIGLATVYKLVEKHGLMPPNFFWKRLHAAVVERYGQSVVGVLADWPQWKLDRLFAWRSRPNCFFCFFQRRYEWAGLLEHYPELFAKAEEIEVKMAEDERREGSFHWIAEDYPLSRIRKNAEEIFEKRVDAVCKIIFASAQKPIFEGFWDEMDEAGTSCGLLCGK